MSATLKEMSGKVAKLTVGLGAVGLASVLEVAALVEASVFTASGQYARSSLTTTATKVLSTDPPIAMVRMTNRKAHLLDHNTKAHPETPVRAVALYTPYGPKASVHHPATRGKFMWEKGVLAAESGASAAAAAPLVKLLVSVFG